MSVVSAGAPERPLEPAKQTFHGGRLTVPIQSSPHQHYAPANPASLVRKGAVARQVKRLRQTTVRRLERPVRSVDMPQQGKELICTRAIPMGHKVLERGPNQLRSRFEIVVLSPHIMMDQGVGMRTRRALEQDIRESSSERRGRKEWVRKRRS